MSIFLLIDDDYLNREIYTHVYSNREAARKHLQDLGEGYCDEMGWDTDEPEDRDNIDMWEEDAFLVCDVGHVWIEERNIKDDY